MNDLMVHFKLNSSALGHLTSAVQFGFIIGTLTFAIFTISDRFSPSKVFFLSAACGALCNLGILWKFNNLFSLLVCRFFTGFFLAGIYPVGMKIATDYFKNGLGKSLGYLVGALVMGTAFPHFLNGIPGTFHWKSVLLCTSCMAVLGGLLIFVLVPDGPYRKPSKRADFSAFLKVFQHKKFRSVTFAYFGHAWELYTFWAFVPIILTKYGEKHTAIAHNISMFSFLIIGIGGISCVLSGYLSQKYGPKKIAHISLVLSCLCCLISPIVLNSEVEVIFLGFLFVWGMVVISDSPLLSTMIAQNTTAEHKGTALTIVNCIGFLITIVSIQCISYLIELTTAYWIYSILAIGPAIGVFTLRNKNFKASAV